MAAVRKIRETNREVWGWAAAELTGGTPLVITTDIQLQHDLALTKVHASTYLDDLKNVVVIYEEESRVGSPIIPPPQNTASGTGKVIVTISNTAAPGNLSRGELLVELRHSIER